MSRLYELERNNEGEKIRRVEKTWQSVKPPSKQFPKRLDEGHVSKDLPELSLVERSVIAPVQTVVTVTKNFYSQKRLRQESITLTQDPDHTWASIIPRSDLKSSHVMIERMTRDRNREYLIANKNKVAVWLQKLFRDHDGIVNMKDDGKLSLSAEALAALKHCELAEVDEMCEESDQLVRHERRLSSVDADPVGLAQASMQPASRHHTFSFEKTSGLYTRFKDALKIKREGKIQVVEDSSIRTPAFHVSPTMSSPHLYCEKGQKSPADLADPHEAADMMRKLD